MKLTEIIRQSFVQAVLADTPKEDYDEQINKLIAAHLESIAPAEVLRLYKDPKTKGYFGMEQARFAVPNGDTIYSYQYLIPCRDWRPDDQALLMEIARLRGLRYRQNEALQAVREKLRATIKGFTTVESARKAMPEFSKYLPDEKAPIDRTVPAIANVVADLSKLGWPKGKQPPAEEKAAEVKPAEKAKPKPKAKAKARKAVAA